MRKNALHLTMCVVSLASHYFSNFSAVFESVIDDRVVLRNIEQCECGCFSITWACGHIIGGF